MRSAPRPVQAAAAEPAPQVTTDPSDALKYRLLFDNSPDGLLLLDLETLIPSEFNDALLRMLGYSRAEFAARPVSDYVPEEFRAAFAEHIARLIATGSDDFECFVRCADGTMNEVHARCVLFEIQGRKWSQSIIRDVTAQKNQAREARERERQLRLAVDLARLSMDDWDIASGRMTSYRYASSDPRPTVRELTYDEFLSRIHPVDRERVRAAAAHSLLTGQQYREVFRYNASDGEEHWLMSQGGVEMDVHGNAVRMGGATVDVTALYRTQAALRESERRFERMADLAPVLMWVSGPDGACSYFNQTWLSFTGLTLAQAAGWGWLDCVHPADAGRWQSMRDHGGSMAQQRSAFRAEFRLRRADGKYRWIDAQGAPRFDADGGFLGYVGCGVDVTDRAEAEIEIGEWKARYDAAARASGQVLYDWDRATNHIIWSSATQDVFGYSPAQLRTREDWVAKVHPEDRHRLDQGLDEFLVGENPEPSSYRVMRPDGSHVMIEARRLALRNAEGTITRVIGFLTDITERRRLEREVIEVANREQVRIGNDLHDGLGQELTGIALMMKSISSQALAGYPQLAAELATVTDLVSHAVASCRSLAQGVSAYALERGGLETALMELAQTSRTVFGFGCTTSCARGLSRQLNEQQAYQLYRIAQEAVSNAAKHSGGSKVDVRLEADGPNVRLVVTDDGHGARIDARGANGMGLRTMRYRAGTIGAQLRIAAADSGGTCVTCTLKLDTPAACAPRSSRRKAR
ncbi:MAG TPA: PAS domain S-box protein [Steroidobacteraceae bacterium]|nr:PAS domain S-box protein [Steroidobacteraceae bacterium]